MRQLLQHATEEQQSLATTKFSMMGRELASILVGDHLGQVKKVLLPSGEISILPDFPEPNSANPVVSIRPIDKTSTKHLIAYKEGDLFIHDSVRNTTQRCDVHTGDANLIKALISDNQDTILVYEKRLVFYHAKRTKEVEVKLKKGQITSAKVLDGRLAIVGRDIPLKIFDVKTKKKIYDADPPEKDWLGIQPECYVVGLDFVGPHRIATCSKSDSVIRVYDIESKKTQPIITVNLDHTAFNEYAEAGRFFSIASADSNTNSNNATIVVGSNVGQLIAIELRFNRKIIPKKKLQPRTHKVLGGFKGARGASIKDVIIFESGPEDDKTDYKVVSCSLDRFMRIYNMSRTSGRHLDKQIYMKTKPICCSPVFYEVA